MYALFKQRSPLLLHLLGIAFLLIALVHVFGIVQSIRSWNWLLAAGYFPHPMYTILRSTTLALAFLAAAAVLWYRAHWAPHFCSTVIVLAATWYWVDRIITPLNPLQFKDQLFPLVSTALLLFLGLVSLYLLQPFMRSASLAMDTSSENRDEHE